MPKPEDFHKDSFYCCCDEDEAGFRGILVYGDEDQSGMFFDRASLQRYVAWMIQALAWVAQGKQ